MGLFSKRKKHKAIETIPTPENETPDVPITLGNCYNVNEKLKVMEEIDKSQILDTSNKQLASTKSSIDNILKTKLIAKDRKYEFWWILNFHANYFQNLFRFELDDIDLFKKVLMCFRYSWIYGNCGIYKLGDNFVPVYEIKTELDGNGEIKKIHLGLLSLIINSNEIVDIGHQEVWLKIDKNDENYARLIANTTGMGAVITWLPFIKQQTDNLKRIYTLSYILNKKICYHVNDWSFLGDELELFADADLLFAFKLDGFTGNVFSVEELQGLQEGVESSITYYEFFVKIYYELLGRRLNVDYKMERNVAAEIDSSQNNFDILEFEMKSFRRLFLNKVSELSGIQWKDLEQGEMDDSTGMDNEQSDEQSMSWDKH